LFEQFPSFLDRDVDRQIPGGSPFLNSSPSFSADLSVAGPSTVLDSDSHPLTAARYFVLGDDASSDRLEDIAAITSALVLVVESLLRPAFIGLFPEIFFDHKVSEPSPKDVRYIYCSATDISSREIL
jgi:hypothetical protein